MATLGLQHWPLALRREEGTTEMLRAPEQAEACGARESKSGRLKPKGTQLQKRHRMAIYLVGIKILEQ